MQVGQLFLAFSLTPFLIQVTTSHLSLPSSSEQLHVVDLEGQDDCFPGLVYDQQCNTCSCVDATLFGYGIVCQGNQTRQWQTSFCISSDWKNPDQVVGGVCPYFPPEDFALPRWKKSTPEDMNSLFCDGLNRNRTLCGKCAVNYSLAINTYDFRCLPSSQCKSENILILILSTFGPLTAFYVLVFLLQVNVAASYMFSYVLYAQTVSLFSISIQNGLFLAFKSLGVAKILTQLLISSYNIWTLDILTIFMPPICINDEIGTALAISLQYIIALYPLLMILLSYLLVELYDRNFRVVVYALLPVRKCLSLLHVRFDPISSLLTTFATFFFLSFSRMTITSLMLLSYTHLVTPNGTIVRTVFLYDATMDYFGSDHLPYALLAITVAVTFIAVPLILVFLYPTTILHNGLRKLFSFRQVQMLIAFMEVCQGHLKDGTDGNRDYRYLAGGQLLLRLLTFIIFFQTREHSGLNFFLLLNTCLGWSIIILIFNPFKKDIHNKFECIMIHCIIAMLEINSYNLSQELILQNSVWIEILLYISIFLPAIVFLIIGSIWIGRKCGCLRFCNKFIT